MFKFVHVWGFGFKGKLDGGRREAIWSASEKNWVGGRVGFFNLAKSGPEKNLPGLFATSGKDVLQSRVHWDVI